MRKKQVRGEELRKEIEQGIRKLAAEAKAANTIYKYNASQLANAIGTSRPTLSKHAALIEKVLKDLAASKRMERGEGVIQLMRERIERLESEKVHLQQELDVLRLHHAEIYLKIYYHAGDLEALVRPSLEEEIFEADRCILCRQKIEEVEQEVSAPKPSKVIKLSERNKGEKPQNKK